MYATITKVGGRAPLPRKKLTPSSRSHSPGAAPRLHASTGRSPRSRRSSPPDEHPHPPRHAQSNPATCPDSHPPIGRSGGDSRSPTPLHDPGGVPDTTGPPDPESPGRTCVQQAWALSLLASSEPPVDPGWFRPTDGSASPTPPRPPATSSSPTGPPTPTPAP